MTERQQHQYEEIDEVSSESDAPEEESNVVTKRNLKSIDKSRKVPKRSTGKSASSIHPKTAIDNTSESTNGASEEASTSSSALSPAPSHLLDPSLFAASFAKKRAITPLVSLNKTEPLLNQSKPTKKRFGVAKGHDGQPMKRLKDGRTIVRVLQRDTRNPSTEEVEVKEETLQPPSALDSSEVLPNAKIRGFRKQKLGLRDESMQVKKSSTAKKFSRMEEDPLGLEDPAFMKGGALEGVGLASKRSFGGKPRPSTQVRGRRTKFTPSMNKGQALQFARSV